MSSSAAASPPGSMSAGAPPKAKRDKTQYLYMAVIAAMLLGIAVGFAFPGKDGIAVGLKPLGTGFIALIKMIITPIIFCTIVLGIGSVRKAASVGKVGGLALGYFMTMTVFALGIGLVVGNIVKPGSGLHLTAAVAKAGQAQSADAPATATEFILHLIPDTLISALTAGNVLQALLVALLFGFALQSMGERGVPVLRGVAHLQRVVFKILAMIMWAAPVGVFGAMAAVVGSTGISIWRLMKYLGKEYLLIVSTSSSETALPRLMGKMQHLGVARPVVGVVVPTGYSFNLDGTMIYLTMASLFVAEAMGKPMKLGEQIGLLLFMMLASKGAAGVTGAGLATLAAGIQSHRPELLDGVGLVVGIDRMMSEARAVTNFTGNAVATVLVGSWTGQFDREQAHRVLAGQDPFDEAAFATGDDHGLSAWDEEPAVDADVDDETQPRAEKVPVGV